MTNKYERAKRTRKRRFPLRARSPALRWALVLALALGLALSGGIGSEAAKAQAETALIPTLQDGQYTLTSDWQVLMSGETDAYRFDYAGNNQPLRVVMHAWPVEYAGFEIWTEAGYSLSNTSDISPVGSGTLSAEEPRTFAWEVSNETPQTYIATVTSDQTRTFTYELTVEGEGLTEETTPDRNATVVGLPDTEVNVRMGPSTDYSVIRTIASGTPIDVLGQDTSSNWLRVQLADDTIGWIARFLTSYTGTAPTIPAPDQETTAAPTPTPTAAPIAFTPPDQQPLTDAATIVTALPSARVNVRTGPSTDFAIMTTVDNGSVVTVLGQSADGDWLQVQLADDSVGWVARFLTDYAATAETVSAPSPPAETTPVPLTAQAETGVAPLPGEAGRLVDPPVQSELLADRWRLLQDGDVHWYSFQHPGDESPVQIWMVVDPAFGAGFGVYSESDAQAIRSGQNPDDFAAIGRGTSNPDEPGTLFWRGTFDEAGRFYVRVRHGASGTVRYDIFGSGPGFSSP